MTSQKNPKEQIFVKFCVSNLQYEMRICQKNLTAISDLIKRKIPRKFRILQMICDCFHVFPSKREVFSLKDAILFWCCLPNVKSNFQLAKWRKKNIPFSDRFSQFWWSLTNAHCQFSEFLFTFNLCYFCKLFSTLHSFLPNFFVKSQCSALKTFICQKRKNNNNYFSKLLLKAPECVEEYLRWNWDLSRIRPASRRKLGVNS